MSTPRSLRTDRPLSGRSWRAGALATAAIAVCVAASVPAAAADVETNRAKRHHGTVAGPIIGGLAANNGYYAYGPYYGPGAPLPFSPLYGPAAPVAPGCYMQRQRIWTEYGWRWREGPICY